MAASMVASKAASIGGLEERISGRVLKYLRNEYLKIGLFRLKRRAIKAADKDLGAKATKISLKSFAAVS
jgi:hypothetical protein